MVVNVVWRKAEGYKRFIRLHVPARNGVRDATHFLKKDAQLKLGVECFRWLEKRGAIIDGKLNYSQLSESLRSDSFQVALRREEDPGECKKDVVAALKRSRQMQAIIWRACSGVCMDRYEEGKFQTAVLALYSLLEQRNFYDFNREIRNLLLKLNGGCDPVISSLIKFSLQLSGLQFEGMSLPGVYLVGASLIKAEAEEVNFSGSNLLGACLSGAKLKKSNFKGAVMTEADLRSADLRGADFTGADLRDANLVGANIEGAVFKRAQLWRAKLHTQAGSSRVSSTNVNAIELRGANNFLKEHGAII